MVQFNSSYVAESGNEVELWATYKASTSMEKPLAGKTVIMLGDSISQLPRTGVRTAGFGVPEFFAEDSGATVIRGAFGGSQLRARRTLTSTADIVDTQSARAAFDIVYVIKALYEQDWTLQDAAMAYLQANDANFDTFWPTILAGLKSADMAKVNIITILAGTNDYANNVPLGEVTSTSIGDENGAINYIVQSLSTAYPKLSIFFFTPIVKIIDGDWCEDVTNSINLHLSDYVSAILAGAERHQCASCDLYHTMGWNRYNFSTFAADGTHPYGGFDCLGVKMSRFVGANLNR